MKSKRFRLVAIIIGVVVALALGGLMLSGILTRAGDVEPRDLTVSEVTDTSAKLTWATGSESQGVVEYGTSPDVLTAEAASAASLAPETAPATAHSVDLSFLEPGTTYYFQIRINDKVYTNSGVPWTFATAGAAVEVPTEAPTAAPTSEVVPTGTDTSTDVCNETNCEKMKEKFGQGCTTQDYIQCVRKLTPTP